MNLNLSVGNKLKMTVISAVFGALLVAVQVAIGFLPNIELVTTLTMVFGACCGGFVFISVYVFVLLEGLIYGFSLWWIGYLYVWLIPAFVGILMRRINNPIIHAAFAAMFGLFFGLLMSPPELILGKHEALAYIIAGIPFDVMHCIGNGVLTVLLYLPLKKALSKSLQKIKN